MHAIGTQRTKTYSRDTNRTDINGECMSLKATTKLLTKTTGGLKKKREEEMEKERNKRAKME